MIFLMTEENLKTTNQIDRGVKIQPLSEVSHAVVVMECLDTRYKTESEGDATMIHEEEFGDVTSIGESSEKISEVGRGADHENMLPELQESLVIVEESERSRNDNEKILPQEESAASAEERMIELDEVNRSEVQTNDVDEIAAESQITSQEVAVEEEVLLPDSVTPAIQLFLFNVILPTIDIFLDIALVKKLFLNGYLGSGLFVTGGIVTNFLFTSLAWWRLEPGSQKKWSWIFLALQLWPQLRAFQVLLVESSMAQSPISR